MKFNAVSHRLTFVPNVAHSKCGKFGGVAPIVVVVVGVVVVVFLVEFGLNKTGWHSHPFVRTTAQPIPR